MESKTVPMRNKLVENVDMRGYKRQTAHFMKVVNICVLK